jgi:hypothetical protein
MNHDQFRAEEGLRLEHATYVRSPVGQMAIAILREMGRPTDVPSGTDALASARILSQYHGYNAALDDLLRLAEPPGSLGTKPLPEPQWGADPELGDQLPLQVHLAKMKEIQDARDQLRAASVSAALARAASASPDDDAEPDA